MLQSPFAKTLKIATSVLVGTEAPPTPPDVVLQLDVLFQLAGVVAIQNLLAALVDNEKAINAIIDKYFQ